MNEKEIKQLKKDIEKEREKVSKSKKAATQYLIEMGVLNRQGHLKKQFKSFQ